MRRIIKLALQKPELASAILLVLLIALFQIRSDGIFLSVNNLRGILGLLPETALAAVGVTLLMICGEFDLSVGSVFALMPMTVAVLTVSGWPFCATNTAASFTVTVPWLLPWCTLPAGIWMASPTWYARVGWPSSSSVRSPRWTKANSSAGCV